MFRKLLRAVLAYLTRKTIEKHKPLVIVVEGEDSPTVIRQALYIISSEKHNTRQNLEQTYCEFSVPLTIVGTLYYPETYLGWLKVIIKTFIQLFYIKPYKHALVVNLHYISQEIFDLWFSVLSPEVVVTTGKSFIKPSTNLNFKHLTIEKSEINKILHGEITKTLKGFARLIDIEIENNSDMLLRNALQPTIKILPSRENSLIIDARHFYYPSSIKTIIEMSEAIPGKKFIFTKILSDLKQIPKNFEVISKNDNFKIVPGSIYIFRGEKDEYINEIETLSVDGFDIQ